MGRTAHERMLSKQKVYFGVCNHCGADYRTAGSLEPYDLISGATKTFCKDCAITFWAEIVNQPDALNCSVIGRRIDSISSQIKEPSKYGSCNEGQESSKGYSPAVSGLCDMTPGQERMFEAECRFWAKLKQSDPDAWAKQLSRLKRTRGTIFVQHLIDGMTKEEMA